MAFPEFCDQTKLNNAGMFMYMFAKRLHYGIRSRSAFKVGSFSSHSCSLAVHLHNPSRTTTGVNSRNVLNTTRFAHVRISVRFC